MASGDYKIEKVSDPADPMRCQAVIKSQGQCPNKATVLGGFCAAHGGNKAIVAQEKENIRNYQVAKWQTKLNRHADSPRIKNLRDEIAILRMTLEERLNRCHDESELLLQSHVISDLVGRIERLVKTCHTLEGSMGQLLDKQAVLNFASGVIKIISDELQDEEVLNRIADKIIGLVGDISNGDSDSDSQAESVNG